MQVKSGEKRWKRGLGLGARFIGQGELCGVHVEAMRKSLIRYIRELCENAWVCLTGSRVVPYCSFQIFEFGHFGEKTLHMVWC